jgi:hypothetical protein
LDSHSSYPETPDEPQKFSLRLRGRNALSPFNGSNG